MLVRKEIFLQGQILPFKIQYELKPGCVAQSVLRQTQEPEVPGSVYI